MLPDHVQQILDDEGIIACVGTGRSGKTALSHYLAECSNKPVYLLGYPSEALQMCPPDWKSVTPEQVFNLQDCTLILDDAALFLSSRDFADDWAKKWVRFQTIISHKGITLIFSIQSMNLLDICVLRSQRMSVLYKFSDLVNVMYERAEFKRVAIAARNHITHARNLYPETHSKSWVWDHTMGRAWSHPLANHWDQSLSIPYKFYNIGA